MHASTAPSTTFSTGVEAKTPKTTQEVHGAPPADSARPQGPVNMRIREQKSRVEEPHTHETMTEVSEPDVANLEAFSNYPKAEMDAVDLGSAAASEAEAVDEGSSNHRRAEIDVVDLGSTTASEAEADDEGSSDCLPPPCDTHRGDFGCSMRAESSEQTSSGLQPFREHESDSESQNCGNQNKRHLPPDEDCDETQIGDRKKRRLC